MCIRDCQIRWRLPGKGTRCLTTRSPDYLSVRRSHNDSLLPSPNSRLRNWATSPSCGRTTSRSPRSRTQAVFPSQTGIRHWSPRQHLPLLRARNPISHSQPLARFARRARRGCGRVTICRSDREPRSRRHARCLRLNPQPVLDVRFSANQRPFSSTALQFEARYPCVSGRYAVALCRTSTSVAKSAV